jgi:hypothetical protein
MIKFCYLSCHTTNSKHNEICMSPNEILTEIQWTVLTYLRENLFVLPKWESSYNWRQVGAATHYIIFYLFLFHAVTADINKLELGTWNWNFSANCFKIKFKCIIVVVGGKLSRAGTGTVRTYHNKAIILNSLVILTYQGPQLTMRS